MQVYYTGPFGEYIYLVMMRAMGPEISQVKNWAKIMDPIQSMHFFETVIIPMLFETVIIPVAPMCGTLNTQNVCNTRLKTSCFGTEYWLQVQNKFSQPQNWVLINLGCLVAAVDLNLIMLQRLPLQPEACIS